MAILKGEFNDFPQPAHGYDDVTLVLDTSGTTVTVVDTGVTAVSVIKCSVRPADGLESDEMDMDPVIAVPGAITPGVGFDVVVLPAHPHSHPEGVYRVLYERW
jgi:hypothetical protein